MKSAMRLAVTVVMLTASVMTMWSQEMNKKFSMTTKMFVNELQAQQQAAGTRLNARPTKPGLYINSRHQVVIK